ncbi:presumed capsid-scaffolding protein [Novosphingobium sp. Rr 2-17]|uniref:GPO family capsid scaffolding protein n=1 Tax=Novosphingobium sp. Rr 2-17 TaxID=555793 RepID=UPI000269858F|nr:GPO family capsid scaffolding protein [Novosphingobium sp. Rr 2-17]EIZ77755.1 presumed capsid-scaffolding protein [Novosphingobium sp. Rr 2-17]
MAKSKFFRVAVVGFTASDGRKIEESWVKDIVSTFNAETYPVRISCEHIKGFSPEPPFNCYGSVTAVKSQIDDIVVDGTTERRLSLYAQIEPNDQLLAINKRDQKKYTSIEVTEDFGGTGKAGMVGLAVTDNPASLGTEALSFSALKPMFDARKQNPNNLFTAAIETEIVMEAGTDGAGVADAIKAGFAGLAAMFSRTEPEKPKEESKPKPANDNGLDITAFSTALGEQVAAAVKPALDAAQAAQMAVAALSAKLENTPQQDFSRQIATGGGGNLSHLTDC